MERKYPASGGTYTEVWRQLDPAGRRDIEWQDENRKLAGMGRRAQGVIRNDYEDDDHEVEDNNNNLRFAEVKTKGPRGFVTPKGQTVELFR
jgi:hypothetical protein